MAKQYPPVVIVDRQDNPIGLAKLKDAWAKGLHYRVVAVSVTDEHGRILLQRRSSTVDVSPNTWDISVGGHVDEDQTYDSAALVELEEELGVTGVHPKVSSKEFMDYDGKGYFLQLYTLTVPSNTKFSSDTGEVTDTRWVTPTEFVLLLRDHPEQCAEFLKEIYVKTPKVFGFKSATIK